ncbi:MAG: tetratricopeptide repeat protein [Gammaproteobacteria bacterium]
MALTWQDLWLNKNEQGHQLLAAGHSKQAAATFTDQQWQAVAYYRAGDYQRALQLFKKNNSAQGYYNQGNALAHLGEYQQAINAYQQALKQAPDFQAAQHNKKIIEELLKQRQQGLSQSPQLHQQRQQTSNSQSQASDKNSSKQNKQSSGDQKNKQQPQNQSENDAQNGAQNQAANQQQSSSASSSDKQHDANNNSPQPASNKQAANRKVQNNRPPKSSQENSGQLLEANETNSPQYQQQTRRWLRNVPDDPGGLLRQKFLRDHLRRRMQAEGDSDGNR